jgi:hypothetical protein
VFTARYGLIAYKNRLRLVINRLIVALDKGESPTSRPGLFNLEQRSTKIAEYEVYELESRS